MSEDFRDRALLEIERLRNEIYTCQHCQSLKNQIIQLMNIMPPEPFVMKRERIMEFLRSQENAKR